MSLRAATAAVLVVAALGGPASAQPARPETALHRLRNVAAADAATAVTGFAESHKLPVAVVAEPRSNSVVLAGDAASVRRAAELLAAIDKVPPSIVAQVLVLDAPAGFAQDAGLGEGAEASWELTPREGRMLSVAIRRAATETNGVAVFARPQLQVMDNTTAHVRVGSDGADGMTASVRPRIGSDGTVVLRLEATVTQASRGAAGEETIRATGKLADGGTLVVRGARTTNADGKAREALLLVTVHRVREAAEGK